LENLKSSPSFSQTTECYLKQTMKQWQKKPSG